MLYTALLTAREGPVHTAREGPVNKEKGLSDWRFAQSGRKQHLAQLHWFSMKKKYRGKELEFRIVVREYYTPPDPAMPFYAEAEWPVEPAPEHLTPFGWGGTLLKALAECVAAVDHLPEE